MQSSEDKGKSDMIPILPQHIREGLKESPDDDECMPPHERKCRGVSEGPQEVDLTSMGVARLVYEHCVVQVRIDGAEHVGDPADLSEVLQRRLIQHRMLHLQHDALAAR